MFHRLLILVLCNRKISQPFLPRRGLRQRDPLSPLLFVICCSGLSALISKYLQHGKWKDIYFGHNSPWLTHITFADNIVLFGEAPVSNTRNIRSVLTSFCSGSGQQVNVDKSFIIAPCNAHRSIYVVFPNFKIVDSPDEDFLYLSYPYIHYLHCFSKLMLCV